MASGQTPAPLWTAARETLTVVLVDDDESVRENLRCLLQDAGYSVVGTASNGPEGLEIIEALDPAVAVVDFRMPYMNGLEVASEVPLRRCRTRVIILSAYDDEGLQSATHGVVCGYLVKGCPAERIFAKIDEVGGLGGVA